MLLQIYKKKPRFGPKKILGLRKGINYGFLNEHMQK